MRIRTVKPEFFTHTGIFDAEEKSKLPLRVAFIGLWCCADREGRFRWEPRRLKVQVIPYDKCDFSDVLDALANAGFVIRYKVGEEEFGVIPSFADHQHVNLREAASSIPSPENADEVHAYASTCKKIPARVEGKEGREQEGNGAHVCEPVIDLPPAPLNTPEFIAKWEEYVSYRKAARLKALLPESVRAQWKSLAEHGLAVAIKTIDRTIACGWQGLFPDRTAKDMAGHNGHQKTPQRRDAPI